MGLCAERRCDCGFTSTSLEIENLNGIISIESNAFSIVTSSTRPGSPFTNQFIYETDTGLSWRWEGTEWQLFSWTQAPACVVYTVGESIAHNSAAERANFGSELYDPFGWHSTSVDTDRVTPNIPGWFDTTVTARWASGTDFTRSSITLLKNDASFTPIRRIDTNITGPSGTGLSYSVSNGWVDLNGSTDYFSLQVFHVNGAAAARAIDIAFTVEWKANL